MSDLLQVTRDQKVAIVTMNNPPANTWNMDSLLAMYNLIGELHQDSSVRAIVLTGQGNTFFCAGADLQVFEAANAGEALLMARAFSDAFEALSMFHGVTIAAINGFAMGGGLEVALACDIRIAADNAVMALPEAKVGLLPCAGGTQNLTALVGEGWAKRMILCGESIKAKQALTIGLVEQVVDQGQALETAVALAHQVERQSPSSVHRCKTLIQMGRHTPRWHALIHEREFFLELWKDDNRQEGCQAFLEKRDPIWN